MNRDQDEQEQTRHCQWHIYTVLYKNVTDSGAFVPHHCQWRVVIHKFQNLFLSLLLLII
jgi:hypothetical protein